MCGSSRLDAPEGRCASLDVHGLIGPTHLALASPAAPFVTEPSSPALCEIGAVAPAAHGRVRRPARGSAGRRATAGADRPSGDDRLLPTSSTIALFPARNAASPVRVRPPAPAAITATGSHRRRSRGSRLVADERGRPAYQACDDPPRPSGRASCHTPRNLLLGPSP